MNMKHAAIAMGLSLVCGVVHLGAHHSFSTEYDEHKPIELSGVVTKLEWTNPHVRFYLEVKDAAGKVTVWNLELASVNSLRRNGWTRLSLKEGDRVTAMGYAALSGSPMASASAVKLADGRSLFAETDSPSVQQTPVPRP